MGEPPGEPLPPKVDIPKGPKAPSATESAIPIQPGKPEKKLLDVMGRLKDLSGDAGAGADPDPDQTLQVIAEGTGAKAAEPAVSDDPVAATSVDQTRAAAEK